MIRFVPDPARGEYVNIGAIAGDDDAGDWELRLIQNLRRAKAIDDNERLGIALSFADVVQEHISAVDRLPETGLEPMSVALLDQWVDDMQNVVQFSAPAPIVADSADGALDIVFSELVVDPAAPQFRFAKKHRAVGATSRAYRHHGIPDESVARRVTVESGAYDRTFDFAVFNGHVVQLVQCWSFQLPDQSELAEQVKAWAWVVHELRRQGGHLRLGERTVSIPGRHEREDLEVASVYVPPADDQTERRAFDEATAAFAETGVRSYTPEQADAVGRSAAARLARG
jgi:hypothetical protein